MARGEKVVGVLSFAGGLAEVHQQLEVGMGSWHPPTRRLGRAGANAASLNATSPGLTRNADTPSRNHLTRLQDTWASPLQLIEW